MIPSRFLVAFDLVAFGVAFVAAQAFLPLTQTLVAWALRAVAPVGAAISIPPWLGSVPSLGDLAWILVVIASVGVLVLAAIGAHGSLLEQSITRVVATSFLASGAGLSIVTQILVVLKNPEWSRLFIFSFAAFSAVILAAYRLALRAYFYARQSSGVYARNLLMVGPPAALLVVAKQAQPHITQGSYHLVGYMHLPDYEGVPLAPELCPLGPVADLGKVLIRCPVNEVIAIQPSDGAPWLSQVVHDCDRLGVPVRIVPEALLQDIPRVLRIHFVPGSLPLPAVALTPRHWDSSALHVKRLIDIAVSAALLITLSPILALAAVAVRLSSTGPILYAWRVVGQQGQEFTGYKFRTMVVDADQRKRELLHQNEMNGPVFKLTNDPRTTAVGRLLRKYSLDELPQLYSVLKGDMSLVGPRPAFRDELERYEFWQKRKLSIRPGITCLWQVNGRNHISDFNEWVRMDLEYIDNWSLWLDFKILVRTVGCVLAGTGR